MKRSLALLTTLLFLSTSLVCSHVYTPLPDNSQKDGILQVYPGNVSGTYTVLYKSEKKGPVTLIVFDATGKYIYLKSIKDFTGDLKESIDLAGNPKGIYVFEVEGNDSRDTKRIVYQ